MRKSCCILAFSLTVVLVSIAASAQNIIISGVVRNEATKETVPAVSIIVKGTSQGTYTSSDGEFSIKVNSLPAVLVVTSIGFESREISVTDASRPVNIDLTISNELGQEVVVSATRLPERILESPVTVERISSKNIREGSATSYYDLITNLKGVDVVASSMTFKTPTTRGFSGSGNTRFNQIVDGMDNQAPGLNFSVGAVLGLTELDVDNVELLSGASSALYGPGGMTGTLLMTSKDPFKYQGLSFQVKTGIMNVGQSERSASPYYNWAVRYAQKVSDRFAYKINAELIHAKDWVGDDYRNYKRLGSDGFITTGTRDTDPNFDGVNMYGDETSVNLRALLDGLAGQIPFWADYVNTLPSDIRVSRTGYTENEVVNPYTVNFKVSGAIHYKLSPKVEAILASNFGTGNTVYTGLGRYSLVDLKMAQHKLEFKSDKWFLRGYTTQENAGQSYNLVATGQLFNEAWKPSVTRDANGNPTPQATDWYVQYAFAYMNAKLAGEADIVAHNAARGVADQGRPKAGTPEFKQLWDQVRSIPIPNGGLFLDRTDLWMAEGQYNLSSALNNVFEVLVGGNWKRYVLNSEGTLFADKPGEPIGINEYGGYIQIAKDVVRDILKLTASGRYDKNENFKGRFTPRLSAVWTLTKNNNIRLSYQSAYRFPSTQQQWIDLNAGSVYRLIGGVKDMWEKYNLINNPGYDPSTLPPQGAGAQQVPYIEVKPESVNSYEAGYKGVIAKKLLIDAYAYMAEYTDFLSRRDVAQFEPGVTPSMSNPFTGLSVVVNAPGKVKTYGWGFGAEWQFPSNFALIGNISSDKISELPPSFDVGFNTPPLRTTFTIANRGFGKNQRWAANATWRWQDEFEFDSDFVDGMVDAFHTVDASLTYKFPKIKSFVKLGATNLLNQYYRTSIGNPSIGGLYYLGFTYNMQ